MIAQLRWALGWRMMVAVLWVIMKVFPKSTKVNIIMNWSGKSEGLSNPTQSPKT
jgi:hypothetical protein